MQHFTISSEGSHSFFVSFLFGRSSSAESELLLFWSNPVPGVGGIFVGVVIRTEDARSYGFVCVVWSFLILAGTLVPPTAHDESFRVRPSVRREIWGSPGISETGRMKTIGSNCSSRRQCVQGLLTRPTAVALRGEASADLLQRRSIRPRT